MNKKQKNKIMWELQYIQNQCEWNLESVKKIRRIIKNGK